MTHLNRLASPLLLPQQSEARAGRKQSAYRFEDYLFANGARRRGVAAANLSSRIPRRCPGQPRNADLQRTKCAACWHAGRRSSPRCHHYLCVGCLELASACQNCARCLLTETG